MIKKIFFLPIMIVILISSLVGCGSSGISSKANETKNKTLKSDIVPVYSPGSGGAAFILAGGISSIANKYIPGTQMVAQAATGSVEMVKLVDERWAQGKDGYAVIATDGIYNAFKGQKEFKEKAYPHLRAISFIYGAEVYLVVPDNSPIKSYSDLKGKRVGIGAPGSTMSYLAITALEKYGIGPTDFKPLPLGYNEVVQGIRDGSIDAGFLAGVAPVAAYTELCSDKAVRIVPVDNDVITKVVEENPFYYRAEVKAGTYPGVDKDTPILAFGVGLLTHDKVNENTVYNLTKNLFEKHDEFVAIHGAAKQMTLKNATNGIGTPLHPGAEKYFREVGIIK